MELKLVLPRDFKEFIALFLSHEVRFLIVGAYALGLHGRPRNTGDTDFWIEMDPANAKILAACRHKDLADLESFPEF